MGPAAVAERKRKAEVHLELVAKVYLSQFERGARFLREHPLTASSEDEDCAKHLVERQEVQQG
eukprot:6234091-Alexandrium_andersonii.AAC.1